MRGVCKMKNGKKIEELFRLSYCAERRTNGTCGVKYKIDESGLDWNKYVLSKFHRKKISMGMGLRLRPLLPVLLPLSQLPRLVPLISEDVLARLLLRLNPREGDPGRKRWVEEDADMANENDD